MTDQDKDQDDWSLDGTPIHKLPPGVRGCAIGFFAFVLMAWIALLFK